MKKEYNTPELERVYLSLGKDILAVSIPESSQAESGVIEEIEDF